MPLADNFPRQIVDLNNEGRVIGRTSILHINIADVELNRFPTFNTSYVDHGGVDWRDWDGWRAISPECLFTFSIVFDGRQFEQYLGLVDPQSARWATFAPFNLHGDGGAEIRLGYLMRPPWRAVRSDTPNHHIVAPQRFTTDRLAASHMRSMRGIVGDGNTPIITSTNTTTQPQGETEMPTTTSPFRDARGRFASATPAETTPEDGGVLCGLDRIAEPSAWYSGVHYGGTCPHCHTPHSAHSYSDYMSGYVCNDCFRDFHAHCQDCGANTLVNRATAAQWEYTESLWSQPYVLPYWTCDYCLQHDNEEDNDGDSYYDDEFGVQWTRAAREMLVGYHHRPQLKFVDWAGADHDLTHTTKLEKGDHRLFMGVELETELMRSPSAEAVLNAVLNGRRDDLDLFAAKTDGSLNNGIEFVSMPMTIDAWRHVDLAWMQQIADMGVRCWDTTTAGLHVHCSVSAFKTRSHFARWWMLYEKNSQSWIKLAGRHNKQYAKWDRDMKGVAVSRAFKMLPFDVFDSPFAPKAPDYSRGSQRDIERAEFERRLWQKYHANKLARKAEGNYDRYVALNAQNEHTVEQRFWRPSLRHTTLLATLEAIQASFDYTLQLGELNSKAKMADKIELLHWDHFRAWVKAHAEQYPYLDARIALRFKEQSDIDTDPADA